MPLARVNDVNLYYEVHGDGTPLALFMGLGGNLGMWDPELIDGLAARFRTVLFEIRHRTLVLAGRKDLMVPAPNSVLLAQRIPSADLAMYSNAGHGVLTERCAECLQAIIRFLEAQEPAPSISN